MGLLSFLNKKEEPEPAPVLVRLSSGSFTVDPTGRVLTSTLPTSFPKPTMVRIGGFVLSMFQSARQAQVPLTEIVAEYAALKLTARELRGGAIIFLAPRMLRQK
jgi:hypothetical protein